MHLATRALLVAAAVAAFAVLSWQDAFDSVLALFVAGIALGSVVGLAVRLGGVGWGRRARGTDSGEGAGSGAGDSGVG